MLIEKEKKLDEENKSSGSGWKWPRGYLDPHL
jgi:hypothetical protein